MDTMDLSALENIRTPKMLHIGKCCRVCMKSDIHLLSIFDNFMVDQKLFILAEALMDCTGMKISQEDSLPQAICEECAKTLKLMYAFRIRALLSEAEFKKLINATPSNVKEEPFKCEMKLEDDDEDDIGNVDLLLENLSEYVPLESPKAECDSKDFDKVVIKQEEFYCDKCSKRYTKKRKFLKHLKLHESPMCCDICKKSFYSKKSLNKHILKHSSEVCKCSFCDLELGSKALLFDHIVNHTKEANVKCPQCDVIFSRKREFGAHLKKFHDPNQLEKKKKVCNICKKEFSSKALLNRHMKLHSEDKPYQCQKCTKSYSRQDQFLQHMKLHDGIKPYICSFCSKAFNQLCSLKDHIRIHTGETPYLCSECGKSFSNSSNLRQHAMRHSGVKPFTCNLCPKSFTTKGQMTAHMTTHTGVHPYKCDQCGSSFTKSNSLKKHKLIHTGDRPFVCDSCNMRFSCKEHLKRHNRIHTGEKPYQCKFCQRAFTQSNDLAKHLRTHVGQNIYQCTVCNMRFRLLSELKQHYPTHYVNGDEVPKVPISKGVEAPVLILKPQEDPPALPPLQPIKTLDPRITITINSNGLDKNGLAGDITIDISPEKS